MKTYIIKAEPWPFVLGMNKLLKVQSEEDLNSVLKKLKMRLKNNTGYEYDLYGYTVGQH